MMDILDRIRDKMGDYFFLAIILFVLLFSKVFPGRMVNTPSSRESTP